jgi:dihydrofolate reductase
MARIIMNATMSLDGFIAAPDDNPGPLFEWYENGDVEYRGSDPRMTFKVSRANADYLDTFWPRIRCDLIGRHLFDITNGWEGHPPTGEHVVVVSHRPKPEGWHPEAKYTFVDGVAEAIETARELAGDGVVALAAGDVGGQALALGLVDEVAMDVAPVVLGTGKRFFGPNDDQHLLEDPHVVIQGDRVLHLRFKVRGPHT